VQASTALNRELTSTYSQDFAMKLYGASLSPFVRKTQTILELKQLPYEQEIVVPGSQPADFARISPLGKIPALVDNDIALADSTVICEYLEEQYPEVATRPATTHQRAHARWLEEFADTVLAESAATLFFERLVKPALMREAADQAKIDIIINERLPQALDYLETQIPEQGFLFDDFGLADISIGTMFICAEYGDYQVDESRWPKLRAFIERVKQHPVVAKLLAAEQAMLKQLKGD
jgi:glutathione S-transferase